MQVIPMTAKNRKEAEPVFCQVAALRYAKVLNELGISKEAVLEAGNIFEKSQELKAALVNPVITKETKHNLCGIRRVTESGSRS